MMRRLRCCLRGRADMRGAAVKPELQSRFRHADAEAVP
jgi:hypothetical protein